jgi:hypothetical protein
MSRKTGYIQISTWGGCNKMKEIDIDDITGCRGINFNFKCPQCCGEVSRNISIPKSDIQGDSKAARVRHETEIAYCAKCSHQYSVYLVADVFDATLYIDGLDDDADVKWEFTGQK